MPTRYVKDIIVDPATAELMRKAFQGALQTLQESGSEFPEEQAEWVRETLALQIIASVQERGERDLDRLREAALLHLAQAKPPDRT